MCDKSRKKGCYCHTLLSHIGCHFKGEILLPHLAFEVRTLPAGHLTHSRDSGQQAARTSSIAGTPIQGSINRLREQAEYALIQHVAKPC